MYSLYKNWVITATIFLYGFFSGFSGTPVYEGWLYSSYAYFLLWGPLMIGAFEKDISAHTALSVPELYLTGRPVRRRRGHAAPTCLGASMYTDGAALAIGPVGPLALLPARRWH